MPIQSPAYRGWYENNIWYLRLTIRMGNDYIYADEFLLNMNRETPTEDYEFSVDRTYDYVDGKRIETGYEVSLPHQCDEWKIIGWDYKDQPDKNIAIKQMELFVKRAQEALEKLKALE